MLLYFIRPPDIPVGELMFYHGFFLLSSFFFRRLISEFAERNSTKIDHMLGSDCGLKTHVQNLGYPLPYKSGAHKPPFWTTSQLNGNFNGLYLRNETDIEIDQICWQLRRVSYIVPKRHELWATNRFKLNRHFYPPSAFYVIARLRRTQPNCVKWRVVNRANNLL